MKAKFSTAERRESFGQDFRAGDGGNREALFTGDAEVGTNDELRISNDDGEEDLTTEGAEHAETRSTLKKTEFL